MILYMLVLSFLINSSNTFPCIVLQIDVLYQVPPVFQFGLFMSISYFNCSWVSTIYDMPTQYNTVLNTNTVIILFYLVLILSIDKPVYFPQLLHLRAIFTTLFWSSGSISYQKCIWNIKSIFSNDGNSVISLSILSAVYSMMLIKGKQLITSFMLVGQ